MPQPPAPYPQEFPQGNRGGEKQHCERQRTQRMVRIKRIMEKFVSHLTKCPLAATKMRAAGRKNIIRMFMNFYTRNEEIFLLPQFLTD